MKPNATGSDPRSGLLTMWAASASSGDTRRTSHASMGSFSTTCVTRSAARDSPEPTSGKQELRPRPPPRVIGVNFPVHGASQETCPHHLNLPDGYRQELREVLLGSTDGVERTQLWSGRWSSRRLTRSALFMRRRDTIRKSFVFPGRHEVVRECFVEINANSLRKPARSLQQLSRKGDALLE